MDFVHDGRGQCFEVAVEFPDNPLVVIIYDAKRRRYKYFDLESLRVITPGHGTCKEFYTVTEALAHS